ncbi:MAG: hypothetical protein HY811_01550 [Planctomycetes bacterium]|nr:hypothetical protein [Planctomycetota bacterium]
MLEKGFCVKCKKRMDIENYKEVVLSNGMKAIRGACSSCGTPIFTIVGRAAQSAQPAGAAPAQAAEQQNMRKNTICNRVSEFSNNIVRQVYPIGKIGTSAYQAVQKAVKKSEDVVKSTFACCIGCPDDAELKKYKAEQQKLFASLGAEVLKRRKKQMPGFFDEPEIKQMVDKAVEIGRSIQKITDEIESRERERKKQHEFDLAVNSLKNKNAAVRLAAIRKLELLDKKESISYLAAVLGDPDKEIRKRASALINKLAKAELPDDRKNNAPKEAKSESVAKAESGQEMPAPRPRKAARRARSKPATTVPEESEPKETKPEGETKPEETPGDESSPAPAPQPAN